MLEWAMAAEGPSLALLIDHDDAEREFQYTSTAATFVATEQITDVGPRLGWTSVSMARDWNVVFPPESTPLERVAAGPSYPPCAASPYRRPPVSSAVTKSWGRSPIGCGGCNCRRPEQQGQ